MIRSILICWLVAAVAQSEARARRVPRQAESGGSCKEKITAYFEFKDKIVFDTHPTIIRNVTEDKCIEMCTDGEDLKGKSIDCMTAMYDAKLRQCLISDKKTVPQGKTEMKTAKGMMMFEKMCLDPDIAPESCSEALFPRESHAYLVGHASAATITETIEHCVEMCMVTEGCKSALFYYEDSECVMNSDTAKNKPAEFLREKKERVEYIENVCHTEAKTTKSRASAEADAPDDEEEAAVEETTTAATKIISIRKKKPSTTQLPAASTSKVEIGEQHQQQPQQQPFLPVQAPQQQLFSGFAPFVQQPFVPPPLPLPQAPQATAPPQIPIIEGLDESSLGAWGDWSQCDFVTGLKFRARECKVAAPERCRASKLVESVPCDKTDLEGGEWGPWSVDCEIIISSPCVGIQERKCRGQRCKGPTTRYCFPEACATKTNQGSTILRDTSKKL